MELFLNFLNYINNYVEHNFFISFLIFFIFLLLYSSFSIPGNIIFIVAAGYFYGIYIGYLLSISTIVLGSLIFFSFSHFYVSKLFPKIIGKYSKNLQKYISNSSTEYLIIFRMIPGPPLMLQNFLLSLLKITKINFLFSTFVGFTPLVFILVFVGNKLNDFNEIKKISIYDIFSFNYLFLILCLIIFFIIRILYKRN